MPTAVSAVYEESSQYKRWTISAAELKRRRGAVNTRTITTIRENIAEEARLGDKKTSNEPEFPGPEEELLIVDYYAAKVYETGAVFQLPSHLRATAATYLRRFYLAQSPLQYHPKKVMITCLFLATKTCEHHVDLDNFVTKLPKQTKEGVLELEFLISSSISFDFIHWSAYRPLYGFVLDMEHMIETEANDDQAKKSRVRQATSVHDAAKNMINACIWSDLPFLYSPSQLALGALYACDAAIISDYLAHKNLSAMITTLKTIGKDITEISNIKFDTPEMMSKVKAADRKVYYASDPALKEDSALRKKRRSEEEHQESVKRQKKSDAARESQEAFGQVLS